MPRIGRQSTGSARWSDLPDFSGSLKASLRALFVEAAGRNNEQAHDQSAASAETADHGFSGDADNFVEAVLAEARHAIAGVREVRFALKKHEMVAELRSLRRALVKSVGASQKLRTLSPEVDVLLGTDADPLSLADQIEASPSGRLEGRNPAIDDFLARISKAEQTILAVLPDKRNQSGALNAIAVEMAVRVLRVLNQYQIGASATAGTYWRVGEEEYMSADRGESRYVSAAVRALKLVGDDIDLILSEGTWRDVVVKAKNKAHDIVDAKILKKEHSTTETR